MVIRNFARNISSLADGDFRKVNHASFTTLKVDDG